MLESPDAASALVNYAKSNNVEHIVIGARGSSTLRRFLGSVSSHVVAESPCSVTVVRVHDAGSAAKSLPEDTEDTEDKNKTG